MVRSSLSKEAHSYHSIIKTIVMHPMIINARLYLFFITFFLLSCNTDRIEEYPDVMPVVDAEYDLGWLINHYMIYPKSETTSNRTGVVEVSWIVTKEGTVENVNAFVRTTDQPAESAMARRRVADKEVLPINQPILDNLEYAIQLLKFIPASKNGKAVPTKMTTSIEFMLI